MRGEVLKIYIIKKKIVYSLSNPGWLMAIKETDFVSGEEMADVQ